MDPTLQTAFREREMRVEHRLNLVRAGMLGIGYLINLRAAAGRGLLHTSYVGFLEVEAVFLVLYVGAVHLVTARPGYRPWVKYLTITVDLAVVVSFYLEMIRPEFTGMANLGFFRGTCVTIVVALVIVTALRQSPLAVVYGTVLGAAMATWLAWQPGETFEARTWWPTLVAIAGGITWWVSANLRSLVLDLWRRQRLTRFLPRELVTLLEHDDLYLELGGQAVQATILLADIRGFTQLAEQRPAEEIVAVLNEYFTAMSEVIFRHRGMLDKYIGDAILAVFGTPFPRPEDPLRAVRAAEEMLETLDALNAKWATEDREPLEIGIALHTGEVIAGNIGSVQRMDYTVIGDAVNLTSRLEGLNKRYGSTLILSEATHEAARLGDEAVFLEETRVRGREAPIRVYSLRRGAGAVVAAPGEDADANAPVPGDAQAEVSG